MKISRRQLLSGVAASAVIPLEAKAWRNGFYVFQGNVVWTNGLVSGGGYAKVVNISDDGATTVVSDDVINGWVKTTASGKFNAIWTASSCAGISTFNPYLGNCWAIVVAPNDANRIYAVANRANYAPGAILRSDDAGATWSDTNHNILVATENQNRGNGPFMAVDPQNHDVLIVLDAVGVAHYTDNGGGSWAIWTSLASTMLLTQTTSAATSSGEVLTFSSVPANAINHGSFTFNVVDLNNMNAILLTTGASVTTAATTVTLSVNVSGTVALGDTIAFGAFGCVCFDRSSAVVGGKTQGIYIGAGYSGTGVYYSNNAGASFSQVTSGIAPTCIRWMHCTDDGVLYLVNWEPSASAYTSGVQSDMKIWRYVGVAPSGSGLSANTWTALSATFGSGMKSVCSNPSVPGRIYAQSDNFPGYWVCNDDYGAAWHTATTITLATAGTNQAYIPDGTSTSSYAGNSGSCTFNRITGKIVFTTGRGIWQNNALTYSQVPGTPTVFESVSDNNSEVIFLECQRPPGSTVAIFGVEDLGGFAIDSSNGAVNVLSLNNGQGGSVDYAKNDSAFVGFLRAVELRTSPSSGLTSASFTTTTPVIPSDGGPWGGLTDFPGTLAIQTANNFIIWGQSFSPRVTDDGGATYSRPLFDGYALSRGTGQAYTSAIRWVCADKVNPNKYYVSNQNTYSRAITAPTINSPGTGYAASDVLIVSGGTPYTGSGATLSTHIIVDTVDGSGAITAVHIDPLWPGEYLTAPGTTGIGVTGGTGSGATFNLTWTQTAGVYRSLDSGHHFTKVNASDTVTGGKGVLSNSSPANSKMNCVQGYEGHLTAGTGFTQSGSALYPGRMSLDGGATWNNINGAFNTCLGIFVSVGAAKPGSLYPTIYMYGNLPGVSILDKPIKIYRCTTFDPSSPVFPLTWEIYFDGPYPNGYLDSAHDMCADPDVYGKIWWLHGSTGYSVGQA